MKFKFLDTLIEGIIDLEVLNQDSNLYSMLLLQHTGRFHVSENKFGNELDCTSKFSKFIQLAIEENVSLAVTPEYSCPWENINQIINDENYWPNNKKLWVLGCESITPKELEAIEEGKSDEVIIYYDETALTNGNGVLLDPVCYIFRVKINNLEKLLILIQFKTQHMGVWETDIESKKYIWGNEVYILRNNVNSIYLFTNICSEAANFEISKKFQEEVDNRWNHNPYIILSLQMNPKPSHEVFRTYRQKISEYDLKDLISINWGGSTINANSQSNLIPNSQSSILFKTTDVDYNNENRFISNHNKGLYYLNRKANKHAYYLDSNPELFLITNQKPSAAGINEALFRRTGPEVTKLFNWDGNSFIEHESITDGFLEYLNEINCVIQSFRNPDISVIDKERLVCLSCGFAKESSGDKRWYRLNYLKTFVQPSNENVIRLTYLHDTQNKAKVSEYVELIECLNNTIISNVELIPNNLAPFRGNCSEIMFYKDGNYNYKYNLVTKDNLHKATCAYIGRKSEQVALRILKHLQSLFESDNQSRKRTVVWYKKSQTEYVPIYPDLPPSIDDDPTEQLNSISRTQ